MKSNARTLIIAAALALSAWTAGSTRLDSQHHYLSTQRYEDIYYLPPSAWLKVFSLGYREALAGLLWTRTLVYFGEEMVQRGKTQHIYTYGDSVLELDPYFIRAYRWLAATGSYRPGARGVPDVRKSIDYLERAAELAPDDGHVAWDLGAFYMYELRPLLRDPKEREDARLKALEHFQVAVLRNVAPPWLALNTAAGLEKMGRREQQIAFLQAAYTQVTDPDTRAKIELQLARLQTASFAEAFARAQAQVEAQRQRDFPYLDMDLFLQVGPKPAFDHVPLLVHGFDPSAARSALEAQAAGLEADEESFETP
jgi:hypothetical protein